MRTHGKVATYNAGCRCEDCRRASREARQRIRTARYANRSREEAEHECSCGGRFIDRRGYLTHRYAAHGAIR